MFIFNHVDKVLGNPSIYKIRSQFMMATLKAAKTTQKIDKKPK